MVALKVAGYTNKVSIDPRSVRYVADRRVRIPKAAIDALRVAERVATDQGLDHRTDETALFAALNTCAYQATRRAWRKPIPPAERTAWLARWKLIRDYVVEQNVGLVYSTLSRFRPRRSEWDDLRSEAFLALVRAVEGFNPWLGFRFSTYACSAIMRSLVYAAKKASQHRCHFLLEPDVEDGASTPADAGSDLYLDRLRQALRENRGELTERESSVLARRFPMNGGLRRTLEQIGGDCGLSKERVRQIQKTALSKLRAVLEADPVLQ